MKVLLINGSPHEKGCTYTALAEIAAELEKNGVEAEILHVGKGPVGGCVACGGCAGKGKCVFDDAVNVAIEKAKTADGFIFGSPVHYASASGSATGFLDRLFYAGGANLCGHCQRTAGRHHGDHRPAAEILHHLQYAHRGQPVLAHGARQDPRRGQAGCRGYADHAPAGPQHGLDAEVH